MMRRLIVFFVVLFSLAFISGCGTHNQENNETKENNKIQYDKAINAIKDGKYNDAIVNLYTPAKENYKDAKVLIDFARSMTSENDLSKSYNPRLYEELSKIPDNYSGDCAETILSAKTKYTDKTDTEQYLLKTGYKLKEMKDYNGIKIGDFRPTIIESLREKSIKNDFIYNGLSSLLVLSNNVVIDFDNLSVSSIFQIQDVDGKILNPFNILGEYAKERAIKESERQKKEAQEIRNSLEQEKTDKSINIGMSKNDVIQRWGAPNKVNKTITQYGTSEQWVYPGYKYVYFDNGAVTAIQE